MAMMAKNYTTFAEDPNEWNNLASDERYTDVKTQLRKSAPKTFAPPQDKLNSRRDLVVQGETFRWEKGKGNYKPLPKYRPYTSPVELEHPATQPRR